MKKDVKKKSNGWRNFKAIVGLTGLVALAIRAVQLEADNEKFMLGAGVVLVFLLVICVGEVVFKEES